KVPVTVLSRCQRFDLRRVDAVAIAAHLRHIAEAENVDIEDEALAAIARASEGSVRDALSLLDQAIAYGDGPITAASLGDMLGLADHGRIIDLFETVMTGDAAAALDALSALHDIGADPAVVLTDLAEFVHLVTRMKLAPALAEDRTLAEEERTRGREFAGRLSIKVLSRAWQMLLKGIAEVQTSPKPLAAADMVLVRLCYAADMPSPEEALKVLRDGGEQAIAAAPASAPAQSAGTPRSLGPAAAAPAPRIEATPEHRTDPGTQPIALARFEDVVALAAERRDLPLKFALERHVRLVRFEPGRIELALTEDAPATLVHELSRKLADWTGARWMVSVSKEAGQPTLAEKAAAEKTRLKSDARTDPLVAAVLERFPGAEIVDVRITAGDEPDELAGDGDDDADESA
ncbi:MAG: DNA polymerase III subunit gamma/tau, partial [Hyphomicrobiales bacterium]|nr:DNA polymerase III subunit gamma/tau [Hyphomicrobiales bacterium]